MRIISYPVSNENLDVGELNMRSIIATILFSSVFILALLFLYNLIDEED